MPRGVIQLPPTHAHPDALFEHYRRGNGKEDFRPRGSDREKQSEKSETAGPRGEYGEAVENGQK